MDDQLAIKHYNNGIKCAKKKEWDRAIATLKKAIIENPNHALSYNILGRAYMERGEIDEARRCWHTALSIDPGNITAKHLLLALGKEPLQGRIESLLRSVTLMDLLWLGVAVVLLIALIISNAVLLSRIHKLRAELTAGPVAEQSIQEESLIEQTQVVELTKPNKDMEINEIYNQGFEACQSGLYNQAIEKFQQVIAYSSPHELKDNAQYWLAECYYAQEEFARATIEFQKVKQYFPEAEKVFDAELKIAYTYYNLGRVESARNKLLQLSKEWPQEEYQSRIIVLLEKIRSRQSEQ